MIFLTTSEQFNYELKMKKSRNTQRTLVKNMLKSALSSNVIIAGLIIFQQHMTRRVHFYLHRIGQSYLSVVK